MGTLSCLAGTVAAQPAKFPGKSIRILVGVGAGGSVDTIARLYATYLSQVLDTPVIVENRPGAFQIPAIRTLTSSPADGYTLFLTNGSAVALAPATQKDLPYDAAKDFTYVAQIGTWSSIIMVNADLPVHTLSDLVAYSKANPGKLNYASAGTGNASHLKIEYLKSVTGLEAAHIPYKSDADILREMIGGTVQLGIATTLGAMPTVSSGKVRAIAVTAKDPFPYLPNVPGTAQSGFPKLAGMEPYSFVGFLAPAGLPRPVLDALNAAINKVTERPDVTKRLRETLYTEPTPGTPQAFRAFSEKELAKARELAKLVKLE